MPHTEFFTAFISINSVTRAKSTDAYILPNPCILHVFAVLNIDI